MTAGSTPVDDTQPVDHTSASPGTASAVGPPETLPAPTASLEWAEGTAVGTGSVGNDLVPGSPRPADAHDEPPPAVPGASPGDPVGSSAAWASPSTVTVLSWPVPAAQGGPLVGTGPARPGARRGRRRAAQAGLALLMAVFNVYVWTTAGGAVNALGRASHQRSAAPTVPQRAIEAPQPTASASPTEAAARGPRPAYSGRPVELPGLSPEYVTTGWDGTLYVSGYAFSVGDVVIYGIDPDGNVRTVSADRTPAVAAGASMHGAGQVDWDDAGNLYYSDLSGFHIHKIDTHGAITIVAGDGVEGFSGDGGPATAARIGRVEDVAVLGDGTIYLADGGNQRIRKVTPDGIITTVAGTGTAGYTRGPAPALSARLGGPNTIEVAADGSLYFTNIVSATVQRIDPAGQLTTVAGTGYWDVSPGRRSGEGGPAAQAALILPGVGLGPVSMYVVSPAAVSVREIGADGIIRTIAGTGVEGNGGDGGPATAATFLQPKSVTADVTGAVYVADGGNNQVRRIGLDGTISTVALGS